MNHRVSLCTVCNTSSGIPPRKKRGRKKTKGEWDSDDEDESDGPMYPPGIMKPDITFFGEKLTDEFDKSLAEDRDRVDLLLVIGTSLKVSPVAEILSHLPHSVPQILINKTPIKHINPDIVLLGDADEIVQYLCGELQWELPPPAAVARPSSAPSLEQCSDKKSGRKPYPPKRVGDSHVWLFDGAEGGKWVEDLRRELARRERERTESQTPATLDSASSTRFSTPIGDALNFRKREYLDPHSEERALKKVRSEQDFTRAGD